MVYLFFPLIKIYFPFRSVMAQFIIVEEVQDKFASFYDAVLRELRLRRLWLIFYFFKEFLGDFVAFFLLLVE